MHSNHPDFPKPMASLFEGLVAPSIKPFMPFGNVDIQPSDHCPRNFIIFDQTRNRSQIMLHPEVSSKILYPNFCTETSLFHENVNRKDAVDETDDATSTLKEDSDDIDALLGSEYEENEESDDEVSTARTNAIYECNSPDSCSNYESVPKKSRSVFKKSSLSNGNEKKKRDRVRKMVKALRAIVPGANRMSTVAVLDEAVRYLKSLRVEVKKLGVGDSND